MAPHSSPLAWKIPWTEEPGGLQSMGSLRVGHDWVTSLSLFTFMHWRRKWQPTPVFLPGESKGQGSLVGCHLWGRRVGHDWSNLAAAVLNDNQRAQTNRKHWRSSFLGNSLLHIDPPKSFPYSTNKWDREVFVFDNLLIIPLMSSLIRAVACFIASNC